MIEHRSLASNEVCFICHSCLKKTCAKCSLKVVHWKPWKSYQETINTVNYIEQEIGVFGYGVSAALYYISYHCLQCQDECKFCASNKLDEPSLTKQGIILFIFMVTLFSFSIAGWWNLMN